jgi:alkylation response protein AidB-like acyl-CoA dehydrogenase
MSVMQPNSLPGSGPWSWLEPGLWMYRSRELDLLGDADRLLAAAVPAARSGGERLIAEKRALHAAGVGAATAPAEAGGGGHRFLVQVGIQFLAGYHDLNLRDAAHVGHGAVLCHDPDWRGRPELTEVIRGALVGLAATEPADDPSVSGVATMAKPVPGGYEISGQKKWISRIMEADAFVVFARSPEHLAAFYVPADAPGLRRTPVPPAGLTGWSWGELELAGVPVPASAVLGASVGGVAVFRRHFTEYRPLVAATCLGAAAACVDAWVEHLVSRGDGGRELRGSVGERIGDLRGRVILALSGLITGAAHPGGVDGSWSKMVKAQAVQTSLEVARTAARNMGSECFEAKHPVRRIVRDLEAFEHADGSLGPLLADAGQRFVQYSAAILDEISEPTATMVRPRLGD